MTREAWGKEKLSESNTRHVEVTTAGAACKAIF